MMTLAMHELSHNLGARGMVKNRVLAIVANLPMGIPAAMSFKRKCSCWFLVQCSDICVFGCFYFADQTL